MFNASVEQKEYLGVVSFLRIITDVTSTSIGNVVSTMSISSVVSTSSLLLRVGSQTKKLNQNWIYKFFRFHDNVLTIGKYFLNEQYNYLNKITILYVRIKKKLRMVYCS